MFQSVERIKQKMRQKSIKVLLNMKVMASRTPGKNSTGWCTRQPEFSSESVCVYNTSGAHTAFYRELLPHAEWK